MSGHFRDIIAASSKAASSGKKMGKRVVVAEAVELFVEIEGQEDSHLPWIVLSSDIATDHSVWNAQIQALRKRYRVLRYDTRGHGKSDAPPEPYCFRTLVRDVIELLNHCNIDKCTYIGMGLGGMTGLGLAIASPDRIERLVCCGARGDATKPWVDLWSAKIADVGIGGLRNVRSDILESYLSPRFRDTHPHVVREIEQVLLATDPSGFIGCASAIQNVEYLKDVYRIQAPTLFLVGSEDKLAPAIIVHLMALSVSRSRFAVVPNAAHLCNVENHLGFLESVSEFLTLKEVPDAKKEITLH